jgi:hypothetical protein
MGEQWPSAAARRTPIARGLWPDWSFGIRNAAAAAAAAAASAAAAAAAAATA